MQRLSTSACVGVSENTSEHCAIDRAMSDVLFPVRNLFYLGSYQGAINEAQDVEDLSELDSIERDVFLYRSYLALGSAQVRACKSPTCLLRLKRRSPYTSFFFAACYFRDFGLGRLSTSGSQALRGV
jgi:hypothetical protein